MVLAPLTREQYRHLYQAIFSTRNRPLILKRIIDSHGSYTSELATVLHLSKATVSSELGDLEIEGILKSNWVFRADLSPPKAVKMFEINDAQPQVVIDEISRIVRELY